MADLFTHAQPHIALLCCADEGCSTRESERDLEVAVQLVALDPVISLLFF